MTNFKAFRARNTYEGMYSIVIDPWLATDVLKLDPAKEDTEKAAAWAVRRATRRAVKDFIVTNSRKIK